jgi:peptide/nickel transport system substrate-binding protein
MQNDVARPRGGRGWLRVVGVLMGAALIAASCGGGDDDDAAGNGDGQAGSPDVTQAATGEIQTGSKVIYGLEAETSGFDPTNDRWAIAGNMVAFAVYDPLSAYDSEGNIQPYLAESFEPNDDFTEWTIRLRPDIQFHNGQPLDADAVILAMQGIKDSALTGGAYRPIETIGAVPGDDLAVRVTVSQPWASFPTTLVGQAGVIPAPAQLEAEGDAKARQPIGTGPFVLDTWVPDNRFVAKKNPDYWMRDEQGNAMPYLDEIEFRPITDVQTRTSSLQSGTINMLHTTDQIEINNLRSRAQAGAIQAIEDRGENEESFVMLNSSAPPFDNKLARNAVAYATNYEAYLQTFEIDPELATDSAFGKDSPYYVDDLDFPTYNPDRARELVEEYESTTGSPLAFTLATTPVPANLQRVQLLQQMYEEVGMDVDVTGTEQSQFIVDGVTGAYQANLWRQFGATDPDADYLWWHKSNVTDPISLNIARFENDELSDALDAARATPDVEERARQYEIVQRVWAAETPYIWLNSTTWLIAADNNIRDFTNNNLPDADNVASIESLPFQSGSHRLTGTWVER